MKRLIFLAVLFLATLFGTIAAMSVATAQNTFDVLIQAGHEGRTSGATGATGPLGNEIDWTPIVADEATRILRNAGVSVARVNADEIRGRTYQVNNAVFIHFDGNANNPCGVGASVGYNNPNDKPAVDEWKTLYDRYWPYVFVRDNYTENLSEYYGYGSTNTKDAEMVLELGSIGCLEQAQWLKPRLKWQGALIAHFLSQRTGKGNIPDPGPFENQLAQFAPNESWTQVPYYGTRGTYFADVTGDGKADAIVVNNDRVTIRRSN